MVKAHKKFKVKSMRRTYRIRLNDLNLGKQQELVAFLTLCHDMTQYFIDMFWSRQDFSSSLSDLATVHKGRDKFHITTRLAQAAAKQAKEIVRSTVKKGNNKPNLRNHTFTCYSHFGYVEEFNQQGFDYALVLTGSGAPKLIIPFNSDLPLNKKLVNGWVIGTTFRIGYTKDKTLWVEVIVEKAMPELRTEGSVVGMDSNYKQGLVFSNGTSTGTAIYEKIQTFTKRQKNTHKEIDSMFGQALNQTDLSGIKVLVIEDLKYVKSGKRGTFSRRFNSRLSHWLYAKVVDRIVSRCEELGIRLERKLPAYTSQYCAVCNKWDKRSRKGSEFHCVHCGHTDDADHNAAKNLEFLGTTGFYGIRALQAAKCV